MAELKPKLRVDVNHNPTKKGIKVQFVLPQTLEGDKKAEVTQKLQSKLNQGLQQYNLTVSQDTDVPYSNVIGFLIPIADIKLLIKNAIGGGQATPEEAPAEETPAPEEPVAEAIKRIKELAGIIDEGFQGDDDYGDGLSGFRGAGQSGYSSDIDNSGTTQKNGIYYFNGKTFDEWRRIFKTLPYDDLIEAAELHQKRNMEDMLRAMKKYIQQA